MTQNAENLVMIPVEQIFPHPNNPRKDIGDISELSESIKAQGILQNLTVVRGHAMTDDEFRVLTAQYSADPSEEIRQAMNKRWSEDQYTVIIGHRRLAASKLAGLTEVPCVITEMTYTEQLSTMMCENMQRNDLTIYEQSKGFEQLRIQGMDIDEISKRSGFSDTTVRKRLKLANLNDNLFKDACARGGTLDDYAKASEFEIDSDRDELLSKIGTSDFKNTYAKLKDRQNWRHCKAKWLEILPKFATHIDEVDYSIMNWFADISEYRQSQPKIPDDAETKKYYWKESLNGSITIFREIEVRPRSEEEIAREQARQRAEKIEEYLEDINERHFQLRREFVEKFAFRKVTEKHDRDIIKSQFCEAIAWKSSQGYGNSYINNKKLFCDIRGIEWNEEFERNSYLFRTAVYSASKDDAEKTMLCLMWVMLDDKNRGYWHKCWRDNTWQFEYCDCEPIDLLYSNLKALGYDMSTEEKQMRDNECPIITGESLDTLLAEEDLEECSE